MFIGPLIILLVGLIEPTLCHFKKVFYCSTCFECYYIYPQEPATVCRCIVLFRCVLVYWCGSAGLGWYPNAGWSTVVQCYYIYPQEPATVCRCIVLFRCLLVYWCGSAGLGWYPNAGWSTVVLQPAFAKS